MGKRVECNCMFPNQKTPVTRNLRKVNGDLKFQRLAMVLREKLIRKPTGGAMAESLKITSQYTANTSQQTVRNKN
jgi:hypothetical protein